MMSTDKIFARSMKAAVPLQEGICHFSQGVLRQMLKLPQCNEIVRHHSLIFRSKLETILFEAAGRETNNSEDKDGRLHRRLVSSLDFIESYCADPLIGGDMWGARSFSTNLNLRRLEEKLRELGNNDELDIYKLFMGGCQWGEIGSQLDPNWNAVCRRLRRLSRKIKRGIASLLVLAG